MAFHQVLPLDIDSLDKSPCDGQNLVFQSRPMGYQAAPGRVYPRKQPLGICGPGTGQAGAVVAKWSQTPPATPWSGFVSLRDATIIAKGLTLTGDDRILLGRGLMLNPKSFPPTPMVSLAAKDPAMAGAYRVDIPEETLRVAGTLCNIGLPGARIYGHWIVDVLPRVYRTLSHGLAIDRYVMGETQKPWQIAILEALDIAGDKVLFWDARQYRLEAERLIVPTFARISSELHEEFMDVHIFLREKHAAPELDKPATDRLFIARAEGGNRQLANRDAVEAVFADQGFEIFRPEHWPFVEQIKKLARVAGECGLGMHNTVFCRPGTRVGVLQSSANLSFLQGQIALHAQHDLYYLIGMPTDPKEASLKSSWRVEIEDVRRFIAMLS